MDQGFIDLDAHTESHVCQSAIERMAEYARERLGDPAPHIRQVADLAGAGPDDVFAFAASGAEAVGQVIWSVYSEIARKEGKTHFIASAAEDAPTLQMLKRCEELGCLAKIAPLGPDGRIDVAKLASLITPRTALISISVAQGLTGVIQPVEEICRLAKEKGVLIHLEASYAVGKMYLSFADLGADYLTFSGERIHSVKSSGALFAKKGRPLVPYVLKGSAIDLPALAALGAAASLASLSLDSQGLEGARLRFLFESEVQKLAPETEILFQDAPRLPNTTALLFPRVHWQSLEYFLERKGLRMNAAGGYAQHLHKILASSGIETESALSFSLSRMTTQDDVLKAASLIGETVRSLQLLSEDLF